MDKFECKMISNWMGLLGVEVTPDFVESVLENEIVNGFASMVIVQIYKLHETYELLKTKTASGLNVSFIEKVWQTVQIPEKDSGAIEQNVNAFLNRMLGWHRDSREYNGVAVNALLSSIITNAYGNYKYVMGSIIANEFLRWNRRYILFSFERHQSLLDEFNETTFNLVMDRLIADIENIDDMPCSIIPGIPEFAKN